MSCWCKIQGINKIKKEEKNVNANSGNRSTGTYATQVQLEVVPCRGGGGGGGTPAAGDEGGGGAAPAAGGGG